MSCLSGPLSDDSSNLSNERAWSEYRQARDVEHVQSLSVRAYLCPRVYCPVHIVAVLRCGHKLRALTKSAQRMLTRHLLTMYSLVADVA